MISQAAVSEKEATYCEGQVHLHEIWHVKPEKRKVTGKAERQ